MGNRGEEEHVEDVAGAGDRGRDDSDLEHGGVAEVEDEDEGVAEGAPEVRGSQEPVELDERSRKVHGSHRILQGGRVGVARLVWPVVRSGRCCLPRGGLGGVLARVQAQAQARG